MRNQKGFTLIEMMAAGAASMVVIGAATAFMLKGLTWYDELNGKIEMNRHAREAYSVLAYGGRAASNGDDGTKNVYGIRGLDKKPPGGLRKEGALEYKINKLTLRPDTFATMTVACKASGNPIPDCTNSGSTKITKGWLGSGVTLTDGPTSVSDQTLNVTLTITNPFQAQRAASPAIFTDTYRTIFTMNRKEGSDEEDDD